MTYIDSSALTKLVLNEAESVALSAYVKRRELISSALVLTELQRAVRRFDPSRAHQASNLLKRMTLMPILDPILHAAAELEPTALRSLDAIHLASALELREELEAFVAYDDRLLAAASALGMPVASPGA